MTIVLDRRRVRTTGRLRVMSNLNDHDAYIRRVGARSPQLSLGSHSQHLLATWLATDDQFTTHDLRYRKSADTPSINSLGKINHHLPDDTIEIRHVLALARDEEVVGRVAAEGVDLLQTAALLPFSSVSLRTLWI